MAGAALLLAMGAAQAWSAPAHRAIAELAMRRLDGPARSEVERLLALEPGASMASISTWADEVRSPSTKSWHYLNFEPEDDCRFEAARHCPEGHCVVGAIERQAQVLARAEAPPLQRLKALKYLVHFVADVHQPLHAGWRHDRGGNDHQLQWRGRGSNLHKVWDRELVEMLAGPGDDAVVAWLAQGPDSGQGRSQEDVAPGESPARPVEVARWAEASCRIVQAPGFYPPGRKLSADDYAARHAPVLRRQLDLAALRLAALLNTALAPTAQADAAHTPGLW